MNCPNCGDNNPESACFCHNCGQKLKNSKEEELKAQLEQKEREFDELNKHLPRRRDKWFWLFLTACTVIIPGAIFYFLGIKNLKSQYNQEINNLKSQYNQEINSLKSQLPQTYYTKYPDQYLYHIVESDAWKTKVHKSVHYLPEQGTTCTVFGTIDVDSTLYGLTQYGYIPMNCLEK